MIVFRFVFGYRVVVTSIVNSFIAFCLVVMCCRTSSSCSWSACVSIWSRASSTRCVLIQDLNCVWVAYCVCCWWKIKRVYVLRGGREYVRELSYRMPLTLIFYSERVRSWYKTYTGMFLRLLNGSFKIVVRRKFRFLRFLPPPHLSPARTKMPSRKPFQNGNVRPFFYLKTLLPPPPTSTRKNFPLGH